MTFLSGTPHYSPSIQSSHHRVDEEYFYSDREKILTDVKTILSGTQVPNYHIGDTSRTIPLTQLDFILQIPALKDFYNFFFVDEYDITYEEDMKRFIQLYGKLTNDMDKMYIFCNIVIDYFLNKIQSELIKISQIYGIEYQTRITPKINDLNLLHDHIQKIKTQLDQMYDIQDKNSAESIYFSELIINGDVKNAYKYAKDNIFQESSDYKEMYKIFYGKDIDNIPGNLSKYKIWSKRIERIKKQFPDFLYES